jgi:hypothetical protein
MAAPAFPNPFEMVDTFGLKASSWFLRAGYRHFGVHPLAARYAPRAVFVLAMVALLAWDPLGMAGIVLLIGICLHQFYSNVRHDVVDLRSAWDAKLFKKHSALALRNRERSGLKIRSTMLVLGVMCLVLLRLGDSALEIFPFACVAAQIVGLQFMSWLGACELPEPGDGDTVAQASFA